MARESTSSIQWNQGSFVYPNIHLLLIPQNVLFLTLTFFLFSPAFLSSSLSFPPIRPFQLLHQCSLGEAVIVVVKPPQWLWVAPRCSGQGRWRVKCGSFLVIFLFLPFKSREGKDCSPNSGNSAKWKPKYFSQDMTCENTPLRQGWKHVPTIKELLQPTQLVKSKQEPLILQDALTLIWGTDMDSPSPPGLQQGPHYSHQIYRRDLFPSK